MRLRLLCSGLLLAGLLASPASAQIAYFQDFEGLIADENVIPNTLSDDGWLVGANVFQADGVTPAYSYFAFPSPNGGPAFSGVATGEGGPDQGDNVLNTYNDYNNGDHANGSNNRIQANIFRDSGLLSPVDVGETYTFSFDAKQGNIGGDSTATAFVKVLKTSDNSFAELGVTSLDTTALGTNWTGGSVSILIDAGWVGETLQIGFTNTADNFGDTGVFYDNLNLSSSAAIPEPSSLAVLAISGIAGVARRRRRN